MLFLLRTVGSAPRRPASCSPPAASWARSPAAPSAGICYGLVVCELATAPFGLLIPLTHRVPPWTSSSSAPSSPLPAEPDLAAALGVGRSTVREAKKTLLAHGLLESRGKLGTFVVTPPTDPSNLPAVRQLLDDPTLADLHETRQIVEVASIRLAARRATPADVADLHATLDRIEQDIGRTDGDAWIRLVSFHRNLVRASGNKVLLNLFDLLAHLLRRHQVPFYGSVAELQSELHAHRELVEIVARHDAEGAAAEMRHHLEDSEQLRQNALDEVKPDDEPS